MPVALSSFFIVLSQWTLVGQALMWWPAPCAPTGLWLAGGGTAGWWIGDAAPRRTRANPSLATEPEKTRAAMIKDAGPGWISFFDRRMTLFTLSLAIVGVTIERNAARRSSSGEEIGEPWIGENIPLVSKGSRSASKGLRHHILAKVGIVFEHPHCPTPTIVLHEDRKDHGRHGNNRRQVV
jgi:hypothetical protein